MSDEAELLRALHANPDDRATRMVYADLLEQRGERVKAEMLRLQETWDPDFEETKRVKRLRVLAQKVPVPWRAQTTRVPIDGCEGAEWTVRCPKRWESLAVGDVAEVRHCATCDKDVHYCSSITEVRARAEQQQCVAFDPALVRSDARLTYENARHHDMWMGEIAYEPELEPDTLKK